MLKFLLKTIMTAGLCFVLQLFLPWWIVAMVGFAVGTFISGGAAQNFFAGFMGVGGLWFGMAYYLDQKTDSILSQRIAELFFLPHSFALILLTAFVGGLVGGLGALSGGMLRELLVRKPASNVYSFKR